MINVKAMEKMTREEKLKYMNILAQGQLASEKDFTANLANISAIINSAIEGCNWVGFYLMKDNELVLGPFQGQPACNRIKVGSGVCGTVARDRVVQRVDDVSKFVGHIACDSESKSEIVIPIIKDDKVIGVLDIDSPKIARFSELEEEYLIKVVKKIESYL